MKKPHMTVSTFLMAFLMAAVVAFASLMCLADAFELLCDRAVLLAFSCAAAAVSAGAMWFRRSGVASAIAGVLFLGLMVWFRAPLSESFQGFLYAVTAKYALCYPMTVIGQADAASTVFLLFLAIPLAWLTAWATSREGSALLVLLACAPVLVLCLILVDIAPVFWLVLLTGALILLLLSQGVRERNPAEGSRLAWWLVLPTVILVAGITVLWPPAAYERADWSVTLQALAEAKVSFQTLESQVISNITAPRWSSSLREVDLSRVGPRVTTGAEVLQYRSSDEISYLRGVSLGVYGDNTWSAVPQQEFTAQTFSRDPQTPADGESSLETLELHVYSREPLYYTAYFLSALPEGGEAVDDAYVGNPDRDLTYEISYSGGLTTNGSEAAYDAYVRDHYTQVPEDMLPALLEIAAAAGLDSGSSPQAVASFVRSGGTYDQNTPQVPDGEDFVLYFLRESHRGYCVHFASATVMLLRALDMPARYVTGYAVSGSAGAWNAVTDSDAHAWVEYYVEGQGWQPLDPTPAVDDTEPTTDGSTVSTEDEPVQTPDDPEEQTPGTSPDESATSTVDNTPEKTAPAESEPVSNGAAPSGAGQGFRLPKQLLWFLAVPALLGLLCLRRWLICRGRRERCRRGHPNRRALTMWHWLVRLSKADGIPISEEQLCLAEKARFSQHTLTEEELAQLQKDLDGRIDALRNIPLGRRLWYQFGLVLF